MVTAFKSFQALLPSTIHSHHRALRITESPGDYKLNSTANNKPTYRYRNYKDDRISGNNVTDTSTESESSRMTRQLDGETNSPFARDDAAILKTTDIQVLRQSRA